MDSEAANITGTPRKPHPGTTHRHDHSPGTSDGVHDHVTATGTTIPAASGLRGLLAGAFHPHSHDPADQVDSALPPAPKACGR